MNNPASPSAVGSSTVGSTAANDFVADSSVPSESVASGKALAEQGSIIMLKNQTSSQQYVSHFWVSSSPFFESTLISAPLMEETPTVSQGSEQLAVAGVQNSFLRFFDADGLLVNEATLEVQPGRVSIIEIDPLMGACKYESGMRHAHMEVISQSPHKHVCRIHSREGASILGELATIAGMHRVFFPLLFSIERLILMPLVNFQDEEAIVRGRLFCGTRSPEAAWAIPARATRIVNLSDEFAEYYDYGQGEQTQAYLRLGVRGEHAVGVQLVERIRGANQGNLFCGMS